MRAKRKPRKLNVFGASQTGRLHVWETWDRKDPEFQAGATQIALVRDLKANYAGMAVLLGSKIRTLACERRMPFTANAILQLGQLEPCVGYLTQQEIAEHGDALGMPQFFGGGKIHIGRTDIEVGQH